MDVEGEQRKFLKDLDDSAELFSEKYWYLHTSDLFRKMETKHAKAFMGRLVDQVKPAEGTDLDSIWRDKKHAANIFAHLRADDIAAIRSSDVCRYLGLGMVLRADPFAHAGEKCAGELISLARHYPQVLEAFPMKPLKSYPYLAGTLKVGIFGINRKALGPLFEDAAICKYVDARLVADLTDKDITKLISPRCFARLRDVHKVNFENMPDLRKDILTRIVTPLTAATVAAITKEQLSALALADSPCRHLQLQHLSTAAASGMSGRCLLAFYKADSRERRTPQLGELWKAFRKGVMEQMLAEGSSVVGEIHHHDYQSMSTEMLNMIFREPRACGKIDRNAELPISSSTTINKECFARLSTKLQPQVLANLASPPHDLLAQVDAEMMSRWQYDKDGQTLQGFQVFRLVKKDLNKLLRKLSQEVKNHACKSIPNATSLLAEKAFLASMPDSCVEQLAFSLRPYECKKNPRVWIIQNLAKLTRGDASGQEEIVPSFDAPDLTILVESKGFCRNMSKAFFKLLSWDAKKAIDAPCFAKLQVKRYLTTDDIAAMPEAVITTLDADSMGDLAWDAIPSNLLKKIPSQPRDGPSAFSLLDEEGFKGWSGERVAALGPSQWLAIPPIAFASLREEHLSAISTDAVQYWKGSQVAELSKKAVARGLSVEQIKKLGSKVDPRAVAALARLGLSEDDPKGRVIKEQLGKMPMSWIAKVLYILGVVALLSVIGACLYYFFIIRRRTVKAIDI